MGLIRKLTRWGVALWSLACLGLFGRDAAAWLAAREAGASLEALEQVLFYWLAVWLLVTAFLVAPYLWERLEHVSRPRP